MKKLVLFTAIVVAVSLSACKKTTTEEAPAVVEEVTVVEEAPVEEVVPTDSATIEFTTAEGTEVTE